MGKLPRNRIILIIYGLIAALIVGISIHMLYRFFRRWIIIRTKREMILKAERERGEFQRLGFRNDSEVIKGLEKRCACMRQQLASCEERWSLEEQEGCPFSIELDDLKRLHALTKEMLLGYITDARSYRKQGIGADQPVMRFTHDKIVRLTAAMVELERQIKEGVSSDRDMVGLAYTQRLDRMREITQQSIAHAKRELLSIMSRSPRGSQMGTLQAHLSQKMAFLERIHELER